MTTFEDRVRSGLDVAAEDYEPSARLRAEVDRRVRRHRRGRIATGVVGTVGALLFVAGLGVLLATDDDGNQNESTADTTTPIAVDAEAARQTVVTLLEQLNQLRVDRTEPVVLEEIPAELAAIYDVASPEVQAAIRDRIAFENELQATEVETGSTVEYADGSTTVEFSESARQPDGNLLLEVAEVREYTIDDAGRRFPSASTDSHTFEVGVDDAGVARIESWEEHPEFLFED
jgi:hypothetical protein